MPDNLTFEQAMDYVRANVHRFSPAQRSKMIADGYPGFLALLQFEIEQEAARLAANGRGVWTRTWLDGDTVRTEIIPPEQVYI